MPRARFFFLCLAEAPMVSRTALFAFAAILSACSNQGASSPAAGPSAMLQRALGSGTSIHLRTDDGHYLVAELGGGGEVSASRSSAGAWETFTLITSGSKVLLRTASGKHYLQAALGGGHGVTAASTN